jgi:uncharacterized membrane protein
MNFAGLVRILFAVTSASMAGLCLAYGDFAPMWKILPQDLPGRLFAIDGFAVLVLAASAGLFVPRVAAQSLLILGLYPLLWALIGLPGIVDKPLSIGAWYGSCEALSVLAGAAILFLSGRSGTPPIAARAAQAIFGATCVFYGYSHFIYASYTAAMVPAWLPMPVAFAYITGAGHAAAGLALIAGILPRLAATLEAAMMSLFGLLVWVPSYFADPTPKWAMPPQNQWSELVVTFILAAAAWVIAVSLRDKPWGHKFGRA